MAGALSVVWIGIVPRVMLFVVSLVSMERIEQVTVMVEEVAQYCSKMFNALVAKHFCGTAVTVDGLPKSVATISMM